MSAKLLTNFKHLKGVSTFLLILDKKQLTYKISKERRIAIASAVVVKEVLLPEVSRLNGSLMNKNLRDQTQFSPEKNNKQTNKQTIYSFNDIQFPGLHIIQYYNI